MTTIAILSPGYPGTPGGVTDHTARVSRSWSARGHVVAVAGDRGRAPAAVAGDWVRDGVAAALIQYVPFLYARRGVSRYPERVATAAAARGIRVTVFVHEPWVPLTRLPWLLTGPLQRIQLRRLARRVAAVVTPAPAWQALLGPGTQLLYVGSTLGEAPAGAYDAPPLTSPVVFSIMAAGMNLEWIVAAQRAIGASPGLTVIGTDAATGRAHPRLHGYFDPSWEWTGRLPAAEAMRLLARAPLVLAPYVDGPTGRRTSVLAALSTGARVVSSRGPLLDPVFERSPVLLAATKPEFVDAACRAWAAPDRPEERARRRAWHHSLFDPRELDDRLLGIVTAATS